MTLNDFYNEVARKVDTGKTQINAAETKRVLSVMFTLLAKQDTATAFELLGRGLANAKKKG